ncbi:MAG: hypothetical protein ACRDK7_05690 [Solirubrobacteraceae bacterium]
MPTAKPVYTLTPRGVLDQTDSRVTRHAGAEVQKVQPHGTPPNGLMGMCFVQLADSGELIGQVSERSLTPTARRLVPRDLAREARERRGARRHAASRS